MSRERPGLFRSWGDVALLAPPLLAMVGMIVWLVVLAFR
jgi:hypothetical protein